MTTDTPATAPSPLQNNDRLAPVERPLNLRETVLDRLRTAIITGELAEGELVTAPTLGVALGVSATPVREAMMDLAREGLVETVKNKGFRITRMTDDALDDLAQIRTMLEPPAMRLIALPIDEGRFEELIGLADACLAAAESEDLQAYLQYDRAFHALVLSLTGNEQLVELATSLRVRTRMYGLIALAREGRLAQSAREHHELATLLRDGDHAAAEELMRRHIGHARKLWATGDDETETARE